MIALLLLIPLGIALGIFINYLADVLPFTRRFSKPACGRCGAEMGLSEYLTSKGCRQCQQPRRLRHWLVPVLSAIVVIAFWFYPPVHVGYWWGILLLVYFTLVAITDMEYHAILNQVSAVGAVIGLAAGVARHGIWPTILGGASAFGAMLLLYYLGNLFGKWLMRRRGVEIEDGDALGFGDVYLTGILGLILGWPAITAGLFLGIVLGGLVGGLYLLYGAITKQSKAGTFLPYAPFLLLGAVILLYPPW